MALGSVAYVKEDAKTAQKVTNDHKLRKGFYALSTIFSLKAVFSLASS